MRFLYWAESSPTVIQCPGFTNSYKFSIGVNISGRHSNLNFAHHFVINWLLQNSENKNQHQKSHQRENIHDKFAIFAKLGRQKSQQGEQNTSMYVSGICAEGIFVSFPWWLKTRKVGKNSPSFQMSAILKFDFQKRKQLHFSEENIFTTQKRHNFACDNDTFPKTRGNKNKQWTHYSALIIKKKKKKKKHVIICPGSFYVKSWVISSQRTH